MPHSPNNYSLQKLAKSRPKTSCEVKVVKESIDKPYTLLENRPTSSNPLVKLAEWFSKEDRSVVSSQPTLSGSQSHTHISHKSVLVEISDDDSAPIAELPDVCCEFVRLSKYFHKKILYFIDHFYRAHTKRRSTWSFVFQNCHDHIFLPN